MSRHVPVLLNEVLDSLHLNNGMNVVDCTLGDAGHSEKILEATSPSGKLLGIDADSESLLRAKQFLYPYQERVTFVRDNFDHLAEIVTKEQFGPIHGILFDFGWSSPQFEERGRGFSFQKDELLDMRYNPSGDIATAADVVNDYDEESLATLFRDYGEEKLYKEIAHAIIVYRKEKKIERSGELVEIILQTYRTKLKTDKEIPWIGGLHPATKTFQALRMEVNDELGVIRRALPQAIDVLATKGRIAVITFHSLEDRIVKHYFKSQKGITILTKKPIVCGKEEWDANPRARSAKLRVVEKH